MKICSNIVDIKNRNIYPACIGIEDGKISFIEKTEGKYTNYLLPDFMA